MHDRDDFRLQSCATSHYTWIIQHSNKLQLSFSTAEIVPYWTQTAEMTKLMQHMEAKQKCSHCKIVNVIFRFYTIVKGFSKMWLIVWQICPVLNNLTHTKMLRKNIQTHLQSTFSHLNVYVSGSSRWSHTWEFFMLTKRHYVTILKSADMWIHV